MASAGLSLVDVAARGVLTAFDEGIRLLGEDEDAGTASDVFARLVGCWEAEVPSGVLAACNPSALGGRASTHVASPLVRVRQRYREAYACAGYRLADGATSGCRARRDRM